MILAFEIPNWLLPPFTEQWATTYLQVLFESFLFALGVPTAIYSLIVDNDIKRVAQTRVKTRRYFLVTGLLYFSVFIIVWFIHPDSNASRPPDSPHTLAHILKTFFAATTVTFLPFGVLMMGLRLNRQFKRERVINSLAETLLDTFETKDKLDAVALNDLSYLGEHGKAGEEKDLVLNVIDQLAERVQKRVREQNAEYHGFELEVLIRHIPTMLDNTTEPGNDQNYRRAGEVLTNIWRWLNKRGAVTDDALSTREAIRHLALRAVSRTSEETALAFLEAAGECDSHLVFEIGIAAFEDKKYLLAAAAFTKLEGIAGDAVAGNRGRDVQRETVSNLLGMTAHFASAGPSSFRRAETALQVNEEFFAPTLRRTLNDVFDYHYSAGRYETADKIMQLVVEAGKMKRVDLDRHIPDVASQSNDSKNSD